MYKIITAIKRNSDVSAFAVRDYPGEVRVSVFDDAEASQSLITAILAPSEAIRMARALLEAAGLPGIRDGNATRYVFVD